MGHLNEKIADGAQRVKRQEDGGDYPATRYEEAYAAAHPRHMPVILQEWTLAQRDYIAEHRLHYSRLVEEMGIHTARPCVDYRREWLNPIEHNGGWPADVESRDWRTRLRKMQEEADAAGPGTEAWRAYYGSGQNQWSESVISDAVPEPQRSVLAWAGKPERKTREVQEAINVIGSLGFDLDTLHKDKDRFVRQFTRMGDDEVRDWLVSHGFEASQKRDGDAGPGSVTFEVPASWKGRGKPQVRGGAKRLAGWTGLRFDRDRPGAPPAEMTLSWDSRPPAAATVPVEWQPVMSHQWTPSDGGPIGKFDLSIEETAPPSDAFEQAVRAGEPRAPDHIENQLTDDLPIWTLDEAEDWYRSNGYAAWPAPVETSKGDVWRHPDTGDVLAWFYNPDRVRLGTARRARPDGEIVIPVGPVPAERVARAKIPDVMAAAIEAGDWAEVARLAELEAAQ